MSSVEELHQQAENFKEQEKFIDALKLYEEVIISYQKNNNYSGICEALGGRFLTYKHLFLITKDQSFALIAKNSALSALEIANQFNLSQKIHRCFFRLGEMEMLFNNFFKAIDFYQQSLDLYPQEEAEKGDFQYHLGEAQYLSGDKNNGRRFSSRFLRRS